jgi:hypothetical protein
MNRLNKTQRIQEANRRIEETIALKKDVLDLSDLGLDENDNIVIPEISFPVKFNYIPEFDNKNIWYAIYLGNNNFKTLKNLPNVFILSLHNNKKLKEIELPDNIGSLTLNNTNIESFEDIKNKENIKYSISFSDTPLEKKYAPLRKVNKSQVLNRINEFNIKYSTYVIPKGTVLFRNFGVVEDLPSIYVGYTPKESDGKYYLHPDQYSFFYTSPQSLISRHTEFGNIRSIFVLQNDIEVLLGFKPAIRSKENISFFDDLNSVFIEKCESHKVKDNDYWYYNCFRKEYKDLNIAGWFANIEFKTTSGIELKDVKNLIYTPMYQIFNGEFHVPELAIYPKNKREYEDIVTNIEDFNEKWLNIHLDEYNYKPLAIFNTNGNIEEYKKILLEFMSPEGHNDESGTYHITVNKKDGTYVLAELASEATLKNCVPIKKDKTEYLKDFLEAQMNSKE